MSCFGVLDSLSSFVLLAVREAWLEETKEMDGGREEDLFQCIPTLYPHLYLSLYFLFRLIYVDGK